MVWVTAPTAKNIALTPKKITNELKILPVRLSGQISWYPTVVIVVTVM